MLSKNNNTSNATLARNKRNSTGCATNGKEKLPKTILHQPQCPPPHSPNNNKLPETLATPQPFGDLTKESPNNTPNGENGSSSDYLQSPEGEALMALISEKLGEEK